MIGTISLPFPDTSIIQSPPGIVVSNYFGYGITGYSPTRTLYPGEAYWVKASQSGQLILKTSTTTAVSLNAIDPCPPAPPETPSLTAPVLSCSSCTPGNNPTLSWTAVSGATNYQLWQYTCPWGGTECEPVASVIYSGPATSCTDYRYTVFKKTGSNLVPTSVLFYYVVAQNNFCQISPSSNTLAINSGDGQIINKQGRKGTGGEERQLPTVTKLDANYPNPFNPSTTISYQLASPGLASMRVYNVLGEEIARLVQSEFEAGYYTTTWDASSSSSGIYYLRMIVTDQSGKQTYQAMKKLLLMK